MTEVPEPDILSVGERPAEARRPRRLVVVTVAVSLLAVVGAGGFLLGRESGKPKVHRNGVSIFFCAPSAMSSRCRGHEVSQAEKDAVANKVLTVRRPAELTYIGHGRAYDDFRQNFAKYPDMTTSVRPEDLPESYRVPYRGHADLVRLRALVGSMPGVDHVIVQKKVTGYPDDPD